MSRDPKLRGGVASWYEQENKQYPFLYSEITGYALSAFADLYRMTSQAVYLDRAELAARWLIQNAMTAEGGVKTRFYLVPHYVSPNYCFHYGRVYAFDAAMVGYGLIQVHKFRPRPEYEQAVKRIASFLMNRLGTRDGQFYPYYDSGKHKIDEDLAKWSDQRGVFHGKLALFLIDAYREFGNKAYRTAARRLLDGVTRRQEKSGRFVTGRKLKDTHLHPHAYAVEGLLYGAVHLKDKRYLRSAVRAFEWMTNAVSQDGSVSSTYAAGRFSHHERSDIVAQTLRIGSILCALIPAKRKRYAPLLQRIHDHLTLFAYAPKKSVQAGGFIYGADTDGLVRIHLNAWATMFALQALRLYDQCVIKKKKLSLEHFV